jgi:nucleotide-binding universal stress UspA family protein
MENLNKPIIVPWDFTYVADNAYAHAINVATILNREIIILNLVDKEEAIAAALEKLSKKAEELTKEFKIKAHAIVKAGVIFDEIREVAHEYKAELVVMGTHGRKGVQKITGSWALKVMASSKVPFLVVQDKPKKNNFEKIVFPVDFRRENKEKVNWVNYLAKHFNSKFFLFKRHVSDRGFKKRIISNMVYAENILKNNNVEYEIASAIGKDSFEKETVEFAKSIEADLILVLVTRDISFVDYLMAAKEQYIISNPENIPVMCINPKPAKLASGFRATGG